MQGPKTEIFNLTTIDASLLSEALPDEADPKIVGQSLDDVGQQNDLGLSTVTFYLGAAAISGLIAWLLKDRTEETAETNLKITYPNGLSVELNFSTSELTSTSSAELGKHISDIMSAFPNIS